ncbi:unnamed protein product [Ixodes pacificus]
MLGRFHHPDESEQHQEYTNDCTLERDSSVASWQHELAAGGLSEDDKGLSDCHGMKPETACNIVQSMFLFLELHAELEKTLYKMASFTLLEFLAALGRLDRTATSAAHNCRKYKGSLNQPQCSKLG